VAEGIFIMVCGFVVIGLTYAINRRGAPALSGGDQGSGFFRASCTTCGLACIALGEFVLLAA
jgi:hypothetical protein